MIIWIILGAIAAINFLFLVFLFILSLFKSRKPPTPEELRQQAIEDEEQASALRTWSLQQAAKKAHKVRNT